MDTAGFLKLVWPATGPYCLAVASSRGVVHRVVETVQQAVAYVSRLAPAQDVYFAVHSLRQPRVWNPRKAGPLPADAPEGATTGGWSQRVQANMCAARALYVDLDVDPDGADPRKYASRADALDGLAAFTQAVGLPSPMVVSSGGGVHAYWLLDRDVPSASAWLTMAAQLKALARHHGLKADPACTTDMARILRPVGAVNHKGGDARPVACLQTGEVAQATTVADALAVAMEAAGVAAPLTAPPAAVVDGLEANTVREYDGPPVAFPALLSACAQIRRMARHQAETTEPEWYAGLGVVRLVADGRKAAHYFSRKHPGYDEAETDRKLAQLEGMGPTSCQKLHDVSGDHGALCDGCPHWGRVKGPLMAARVDAPQADPPVVTETVAATIVERPIPNPPAPYKRTGSGVEMVAEKDGQQFVIAIYPYDLYPIERVCDDETETQWWRHHPPHGAPREFPIPASDFVNEQALKARLANVGIYPSDYKRLQSYMSAYIQQLQRSQPAGVQRDHFGWIEDHTQFVLPERILRPNAPPLPATLTANAQQIGRYLTPHGALEDAVALLRFYDNPAYVAHQFYILAGMATPLFHMTGHHGVVINAEGKAGASKSTTTRTAAAMWGDPINLVLNGTKRGSTGLGLEHYTLTMANLPICLDEVTLMDETEVQEFAMNVTQSSQRVSLTRDRKLRARSSAQKSTIVMTNSNTSLHARLASDEATDTAAALRVFEMKFERMDVHSKPEADAYIAGLMKHHGHIGPLLAQYTVDRREAVEGRFREVQAQIDAILHTQGAERFLSALSAVALTQLEIAQSMGVVTWDRDRMVHWLRQTQFPAMRKAINADDDRNAPLRVLTEFVARHNDNIVVTELGLGGSTPYALQEPRGQMVGHYDRHARTLTVVNEAFRTYCRQRRVTPNIVRDQLVAMGVVQQSDVQRTLGAGTRWEKTRVRCFVVDMDHPEIAPAQEPFDALATPPARGHLRVV